MDVAVVGAAGFLGSYLVNGLLAEGYETTAIYNRSKVTTAVPCVHIDDFMQIHNQFDSIFISLGNYSCSHRELLNINKLIEEILGKNERSKIIFISSSNVYGIHQQEIHLKSSFNNPGLYAMSKLAAEFLVSSHARFAILRFTYLYGKNLNNNSFLPNLIKSSKYENKIRIFGNGSRKQDYLHVDDAVQLCITAMNSQENGTFLGASGNSTSNLEVAKIVAKYYGSEIIMEGKETGASFSFNVDNTKEMLKWESTVNIHDGVLSML